MTSSAVFGWRVQHRAADTTVLVPPGGRGRAWAEIRERERPLVPLSVLCARRAGALRSEGASGIVVEPGLRLTTSEGEDGAIATITGELAGEPIAHTIAAVYADDSQLTVEGRALHPGEREPVRAVVHEIAMHLPVCGGERLRRFWYRPPVGWHGVARGLVVDWYAPDYPRDSASIKVLPARPLRQSLEGARIETLVHDAAFGDLVVERRVRDDAEVGPLRGVIVRVAGQLRGGERRVLITAALADELYVYRLRLDSGQTSAASHERVFLDLIKTALPVPRPTSIATRAGTEDVFDHWSE